MAETETNRPDFRNGSPIRDLGDGSMILGQADGEELWAAAVMWRSRWSPVAARQVHLIPGR
jgi:hypothetical protein